MYNGKTNYKENINCQNFFNLFAKIYVTGSKIVRFDKFRFDFVPAAFFLVGDFFIVAKIQSCSHCGAQKVWLVEKNGQKAASVKPTEKPTLDR